MQSKKFIHDQSFAIGLEERSVDISAKAVPTAALRRATGAFEEPILMLGCLGQVPRGPSASCTVRWLARKTP